MYGIKTVTTALRSKFLFIHSIHTMHFQAYNLLFQHEWSESYFTQNVGDLPPVQGSFLKLSDLYSSKEEPFNFGHN